jgi:Der1-like family
LPALQVAIAYRWARLHPNASVHVYLLSIPAPWYPWVFLIMDLLIRGPHQAGVDFVGILGAHLHLFLTDEWSRQGGRRIDTPSWFRNLFPRPPPGPQGGMHRPYGTVIPPRDNTPTTSGTSSGVVGSGSGNFRGPGYRLG